MRHIVIDARIISSSTGRYVERLLHYIEQLDKQNRYTVLVRKKDMDYWVPYSKNISVECTDYAPYSFGEQLGFLRKINQLKPDLVHFTQVHQPIFYRGLKVTTIHDYTLLDTYNSDKNWLIYHFKQLIGKFVFRYVAITSQAIIVPTKYTKDRTVKKYSLNEKKINVTYEAAGSRTDEYKKYNLPTDNFLLYVGQQSDYKNIKRLCDAHQKLLKKHPDLELVLVGKIDSAARLTINHVTKNNYRNITLTGFVDDSQLNWLYKNAKAYVFPSLMEGFGLPGLEAMSHGTPVISSNYTCLPEVYGNAAHYFNPEDTNDIESAIDSVISNEKLRYKLIKLGKVKAATYSWKKTAEQTLEVYKKALRN